MGLLSLFRAIRTIYSLLSLLLLIVAIYIGLVLYTASQSSISDVTVSNVTNVTKNGFTIEGGLSVYNGGLIPIDVREVTYNLTLEDGPIDLGRGTIPGAKIKPKDTDRFAYAHHVNFSRSVAQALSLTEKNSNVAVEGDVVVNHLGLYETKMHFRTDFDLLETIANQAQAFAPIAVATANAFLNTLNELLN